jgi:hypothetical protein
MAQTRRLSVLNVGDNISASDDGGGSSAGASAEERQRARMNMFKASPKRHLNSGGGSPISSPDSEARRRLTLGSFALAASAVAKKKNEFVRAREDGAVRKHLIRLGKLSPTSLGDGETDDTGSANAEEGADEEKQNVDGHGKRNTMVRILDVIDMARKKNLAESTISEETEALADSKREQNIELVCQAIGMPIDLSRSMRARMISMAEAASASGKTKDVVRRSNLLEQKKEEPVGDYHTGSLEVIEPKKGRRASCLCPVRVCSDGEVDTSLLITSQEVEGLVRNRAIPWRDVARLRKWMEEAHEEALETRQRMASKQQVRRRRCRSLDVGPSTRSRRPQAWGMLRMLDELRSDYDPQYRLTLLRGVMHRAMRPRWGGRFGEEIVFWERMQEVVEIFCEVAVDRSGMVTRGEFARAFHQCTGARIPNCDLDNLLELCDPNDMGCLDLYEFAQWYRSTADEWVTASRRSDPEDEFNDQHLLHREILYFDSGLRRKISTFWELINPVNDDSNAAEDENDEEDGDRYRPPTIKQEKYLEFNMNLQRFVALNVQHEPFNEEIAIKVALREWEFDTRARRGEGGVESGSTKMTMTKDQFFRSMLQLVEAWSTEQASKSACHEFLDNLLKENTMLCQTAFSGTQRVWKWSSAIVQRRLIDLKKNASRLRNLKAAVRSRARDLGGPATAPSPSTSSESPQSSAEPPAESPADPSKSESEPVTQAALDKTAARFSRRFSIYRNESKRRNELRGFMQSSEHQNAIKAARLLVQEKGVAGDAIMDKLNQQEFGSPETLKQSRPRRSMIDMHTRSTSMKLLGKGPLHVEGTSANGSRPTSPALDTLQEEAESDDGKVAGTQKKSPSDSVDVDDGTEEDRLDEAIQGLSQVLSMSSEAASRPPDVTDGFNDDNDADDGGDDDHLQGRRVIYSPGLHQLRASAGPASPPSTIGLNGHACRRESANERSDDRHASSSIGPYVLSKYKDQSQSRIKRKIDAHVREANKAQNSFKGRVIDTDALLVAFSIDEPLRRSPSIYQSPSSRPGLYSKVRDPESKWLQDDSLRQELNYSDYIAQYDRTETSTCGKSRKDGTSGEMTRSVDGTLSFAPSTSQYSSSVSTTKKLAASTTGRFQKMVRNLFKFLDVHQRGTLGQLELHALRSEVFTTRLFIASAKQGVQSPAGSPPGSPSKPDSGHVTITINEIFDDIVQSQRFENPDLALQRCILATIFTNARCDNQGDEVNGARSSRNALLDASEALAKRIADATAEVVARGTMGEGLRPMEFDRLMRKSEPPLVPDITTSTSNVRGPPAVRVQPDKQQLDHLFRDPREYSDGLVRSLVPVPRHSLEPVKKVNSRSVCLLNLQPSGFSEYSTMYNPRAQRKYPPPPRPASASVSRSPSAIRLVNEQLSRSASSSAFKYPESLTSL